MFEHEPRVGGEAFAVSPAGVTGGADFSFIVIGDTGEGDASQQILKDQLLAVARREDVRFIVVSSDVVYPIGAMKDYEAKFWLPFKGTGKPVYAIPGNHDWFDALEAFAATFMTEEAARQTMRARIEVDKRLTSTTDGRIEELIAQAGQLRRQYGVPTGFQRAPFFQVQTPDFALLAVDTGVRRTVDPAQHVWLEGALAAARGKVTMVVLGHPFYAGGHYLAEGDETFLALHRLLREHGVAIVMAGDTHDFEYYAERGEAGGRGERRPRRQRGWRGVPELRHRAGLAGRAGHRRLGVPPDDRAGRRKDPGDPPPLEDALLVVDPVPGRLAVLGRVALGGVRRQHRAVLPELRGGPGGALVGPRPPPPVRDQRPPPLGGSPDVVGAPARRGGAGGSGRVEPGPGRTLSVRFRT